ncbi:MAG TPA: carbohydrate-binding protein [Desulfotomaculum sp.]|nr:carbohydrate-binding protein [Desulfotomaculum sp.]
MEHTDYELQRERVGERYVPNLPGGVVVEPVPVTAGDEITIFYNGELAREADKMFLHLGYGPAHDWHRVQDLKMSRTGWGWIKTVEVPFDEERLNFCFRSNMDRWDNNDGRNWSYIIHAGRII